MVAGRCLNVCGGCSSVMGPSGLAGGMGMMRRLRPPGLNSDFVFFVLEKSSIFAIKQTNRRKPVV